MEFIKRSFIEKIVEDLRILNGTDFELFCKPIFDLIMGESSIHKGVNLYAKPISRTVDFVADNFNVVAQCGTDDDYFGHFSKKLPELLAIDYEATKPIKDIRSAIKNSEQAGSIYIFANQEAKAGRLSTLDKLVRHLGIDKEIHVYDSERLANVVYENISNQRLLGSIIEYLPTAAHVYSAISIKYGLPLLPSGYVERYEEKEIIDTVLGNMISLVHGISGIGKSKICLSVAHKLKEHYDSVVWISVKEGEEIDFNSVRPGGFDNNLNLRHLCSTYKTLVILDNYIGDISYLREQLESFARDDCRLIVTSLNRLTTGDGVYNLGEMSQEDSVSLLQLSANINDDVRAAIIEKVGGYPLGLQLTARIIDEENYTEEDIAEFINELDQLGREMVPERSATLVEVIVGRHADKFIRELAMLSLLGNTHISTYALTKTFGLVSLRNLEKVSLVVREDMHSVSIHSIILLAINNLDIPNEIHEENITLLLAALHKDNEFKPRGYYHFCVYHNDVLHTLYERRKLDYEKKILLYAIIQTTDNSTEKNNLLSEINKFDLTENLDVNLFLLIEKLELELVSINRKTDDDKYMSHSEYAIETLRKIPLEGLEPRLKLLIKHHIAKITFWRGEKDDAETQFLEILKEYPNCPQCKLQLARIASNRGDEETVMGYVDDVLAAPDPEMSHSILLSFYDLIAESKYTKAQGKYIDDRLPQFFTDITTTLHASFDHSYRVLSRLSKHLGYNHPNEFVAICSNLPTPDNVDKNNKLMKSYAEIQMALYRAYKYGHFDNKEEKLKSSSNLAEKYYLEAGQDNDFERLSLCKIYIEMGAVDKAQAVLAVVENHDGFYYQTCAKIHKELGATEKALEDINQAIELETKGQNRSWFVSSFLNDKAEILHVEGNAEAIDVQRQAIELQRNMKTKLAWEKKLRSWMH